MVLEPVAGAFEVDDVGVVDDAVAEAMVRSHADPTIPNFEIEETLPTT